MDIIKFLHMASAVLSISGFVARGILMIRESEALKARWIKIAPHINDSILLGSAIVLAVWMGISPLDQPWLLAKIIALLFYIGLGMVALRFGATKRVRVVAWFVAMAVFVYIVAVAITKQPMFF